MDQIFIPHELKTIEVDTEKKIFRINGEEFGRDCTGFSITYCGRDAFDIRVEVDARVRYVSIKNGERIMDRSYITDTPQFSDPYDNPKDSA